MSDPPKLRPVTPYGSSKDGTTEPMHTASDMALLKNDNARLRRERDDARASLDRVPPPPSRPKVIAASLGKYAVLLPLVVFAAHALARRWPAYADLLDEALRALGL